MVAADEADVDRFNAEGRVHAMWWAGGILPERWICREPPSATKRLCGFLWGALWRKKDLAGEQDIKRITCPTRGIS